MHWITSTPISPPSSLRHLLRQGYEGQEGYDRQAGPTQWLFQRPPAESKFLAAGCPPVACTRNHQQFEHRFNTMKSRNTLTFALIGALSLGFTDESEAAITLLFSQNGNDVVLTATGSLSLVGLTKTTVAASLGATILLDTANEQLQIGSGTNAPVDYFTLVVKNTPFNSATNITGTLNSWNSNSNSIRFQQNNGRLLVDDAFEAGDTLTVNSQITFVSRFLADFGLAAGTSVVFLENDSDGSAPAADGQVIVTAIPEPSSSILIGLSGLAIVLRRRRAAM